MNIANHYKHIFGMVLTDEIGSHERHGQLVVVLVVNPI